MTILQKQKIKKLKDDNLALRDNIKYLKAKLSRREEHPNNIKVCDIKVCKYCGHSPTQLPESKKDMNIRVMGGINKLKERGILQ